MIAKGEAQGMVSKSLGILGGIVVSHYVGPSGTMLAATFLVVSSVHMFCNLRSYQAVLRTLNPYRASMILNVLVEDTLFFRNFPQLSLFFYALG